LELSDEGDKAERSSDGEEDEIKDDGADEGREGRCLEGLREEEKGKERRGQRANGWIRRSSLRCRLCSDGT
jgi:hypothetical protein